MISSMLGRKDSTIPLVLTLSSSAMLAITVNFILEILDLKVFKVYYIDNYSN